MSKFRLKKLLKRDNSFRYFAKEDMKYLWAAYKKDGLPALPENLNKEEFTDLVTEFLSGFSEVFIIESPTIRGKIPVAIITTLVTSRTEPNVDWFPWASNRNKLEAAAYFLSKMRKRPILIWANKETTPYFTRLAQYGVLRRIGKAHKFVDGQDQMIFQTRSY